MKRALAIALALLACLTACSFENKNEREADKMTHAVMNNDLGPVRDDIAPTVQISRVQVARWADELSTQGKLVSIKEVTEGCKPEWHCFDVKFEKATYHESLRYDEKGKVADWDFHLAPST